MEGELSTERESEEDSVDEAVSTKRRRITSAVEESLKKMLLLPAEPVVFGVRRRVWVTSATLLSESDESMTAIVDKWRLLEGPVARWRFFGPPSVIVQVKMEIERPIKSNKEEKLVGKKDREGRFLG